MAFLFLVYDVVCYKKVSIWACTKNIALFGYQ
jgi:hypothetical protein